MFERIRVHPTVALTVVFLHLLVVAQPRAAAAASPKPGDYRTATSGISVDATAEKPGAPDGTGAVAQPELTRPGLAGVASVSLTGTIVNVAVCTAAADQTAAVLLADGAGGGIVVWQDRRVGDWDVYAQRLGVAGETDWGLDGMPVCKAAGGQTNPRAVADGAGGVIVVWQDGRPGTLGQDLYAQRLTAAGAEAWASGGVLICGAVGDQKQPVVVADGSGGAIVAWVDERVLGSDVYVQRISAGGVMQWAGDGVALCTAAGVQQGLTMVVDGQGGAIAGWQDGRADAGDIYARRVDPTGVAQWTADGVALCAATGVQETPVAVADGTGGAIVGWADARGADRDVYAQRVSGAGAAQWTADGVALCAAGGDQRTPALCGDGAGGALVAWQDGRPGALGQDVYAQRVSATGVAQWAANGVGVCTAAADQLGPVIAADPMGGALVAWSDARTVANGADIYVQHVNVAGGVQWTANGVLACDAANAQVGAMVIADGQGGALAAWRDFRGGVTSDLYSQQLNGSGQIPGQCVSTTVLVDDSPVTASSAPSYYSEEMQDFYWTGVGVRSAAGSDWDLETYGRGTFGLSPYPTCFSDPLAGSFASSGVDFVVGDFNIGHTWPVSLGNGFGVRASRYSGAGTATVEWDDGPDVFSKDCGTGGACGAKSGNGWTGVLDVWDVFLLANHTYTFNFTHTGSADIKLLLFSSAGTTGTFFVPRSARVFETTNSSTVFAAPANGFYGVVLVNDNGLSGTYLVRVVTGGTITGVGEAPGPMTGLKGVAPNPSAGPVQIQFAVGEPGAVAFEVLDMAGRVVARIPGRRWEAGTWSVGWDGRSSRGTQAAPGIYFVQMRMDGRRVGLGRLALLR
jgi:hypothetical protein